MIKIIASKTRDFQHTPTKATCSWVTSIVVRYRRQKDSDWAKWVNSKFKVLIINIKTNKKILLIKTWKWVVFYKINKIKLTISNKKNPLISSMVIINILKAKFKIKYKHYKKIYLKMMFRAHQDLKDKNYLKILIKWIKIKMKTKL